ncbi:1-phosphatidylinositol 3-phosphate 5-kinase FAB1, partial [Grifola frondosa]
SNGSALSRSRSSTKIVDDVTSLTSFNPFSEEDEHDQSSYALVTSLFSKVKHTLSAPLSHSVVSNGPSTLSSGQGPPVVDQRRPPMQSSSSLPSIKSASERSNPLHILASDPAPPLVSLTPVVSETPSYSSEYDRPPSRGAYSPDTPEGGLYGTTIPGFPIQDSDARSIRTTVSIRRSASVSKVIRRIRGEGEQGFMVSLNDLTSFAGLSRDYWMDDELCKECYDCKSVFTTWRRKHHCRICGQIFCSRCASNIIKGARFGQDGMLRVCNLCLGKLGKGDDDDEDDKRSVVSSVASPFAAHQLGGEFISFNLANHPQSPFAASQLFGRTDEPFNLFSIAEMRRPHSGSDESGFGSRPITPNDESREDRFFRENPVPFRRGLTEEEKDPISLSDKFSHDNSPTAAGSKTPIDFPITVPVNADAMSSVQFPISSPEQAYGFDTPGILRSRFNSYADFDGTTPFIRSRVQSRLGETFDAGEPGWRTRRESTAYAQELNLISMFHLRIMLRQMLTSENIPNIKEWEDTLLKLALRIARELTFTAHPHRQGADMDVRRYVKIKKIPGGAPRDSEYVDGAVITKNVAHKQMSRNQRNPRVMLVTFPLEFHRVEGQYMHFGQIFRQEKEYLGNLASRIAALRPHVVLAEKSVSRLALDALAKHHIAVARTVKPSAIRFVARMTQGDVFSSIDKLALEPHLGHCGRFRIQTFDHPLIPGQRKTYMRFEGCNGEMGCTILLRGGDIDVLRRIKKVTRFLAFIVRNLRLETHLWKDSVITLPHLTVEATPATFPGTSTFGVGSVSSATASLQQLSSQALTNGLVLSHITSEDDLPDEDAEQLRLSRRIQESLEPYQKTFISVSATLRFPPPQPIRRMKELDDELIRVKREWEDEVVRREERGNAGLHTQEETITQSQTLVPTHDPNDSSSPDEMMLMLDDRPGYFDTVHTSSPNVLPNGLTSSPLACMPADNLVRLKTTEDIALESRLSYVKWQHAEQRRIWEWYLRKNKDDFDVEKYQCISLWELTLPMNDFGLHRSCFPPKLEYITFYGENDCTLGQFIEKSVMDTLVHFLDPKAICENRSCNQPLARHCKVYVHNETRLSVAVEQWDGQIINRANYHPSPDSIITWSACRVCRSATPFIPVSEEMQRYSFAKFLELHFYPADVQLVQGAGSTQHLPASRTLLCHPRHDHPIVLHEVIYPPMRIRVRPETQLEIKNTDFLRLHNRNNVWYSALVDDLKLINIDAATGDEEADALLTAHINGLIIKAESEKDDITRLIDKIYRETPSTDTLALNQVRAYRQDRIVAWQQDFDRLPKPRMPQFLDRVGRKTSAFGSVRAMLPRKADTYSPLDVDRVPSANVSEAEEHIPVMRRATGESFLSASSASEVSETESLAERRGENVRIPETLLIDLADIPPAIVESAGKSDPDSDSTIGAGRGGTGLSDDALSPVSRDQRGPDNERRSQPISRLPRRVTDYPSVAELVKKYQDFLPPQGVEELTKTAFPPAVPVSESEQESTAHIRSRVRTKGRHQFVTKRSSISDFEQSYAANIAPKYLTKRAIGPPPTSRIPVVSSFDSQDRSRRASPDKRSSFSRMQTEVVMRSGRTSPPSGRPASVALPSTKTRGKSVIRGNPKEKGTSSRPPSTSGKSTFRRPPGTKVSNMAKHFERMNKDTERANRRYAVIRGKRARPVASARAKVEVLESIKDAIKDESESSDSSEADDEGDGDDEDGGGGDDQKSPDSLPAPPIAIKIEGDSSAGLSTDAAVVPSLDSKDTESTEPAGPQDNITPEAPPSAPNSPMISAMIVNDTAPLSSPPTDIEMPSGNERHSIFKALSGFWPQQTQPYRYRADIDADDLCLIQNTFSAIHGWLSAQMSLPPSSHWPSSRFHFDGLWLYSSPQYRDMLSRSRAEKRHAREAKLTDGEAFMPDDKSIAGSTSTWGVVNVDSTEGADPTEELRVPSSKSPWAISFESGGLTISCTVLYPEQFDALRRTYDCERSMIESLARCVKWDANGGKSGSAFLKTLDDRFIAKELSRAELQAMETFAPAYFDYMSSSVVANRPTLLAKIFGCFKITFRKSQKYQGSGKSKSTQMNLLVMENLFYDRRFSKAQRAIRHVQSTGRENEVLLDENLVETAHLTPFYLREHSKRILRGALFNDSKFLADINVMDYSLVVGVDSMNNELVVGIVGALGFSRSFYLRSHNFSLDYIRTYTWDKKLESWVKDSTFLGGANKGEPTIIGPKQYRHRFLSAMERYFPLVPDRWMKQHDAPEEEGNNLLDLWPDW